MTMYCKLFASLYQGTLRGKSDEILVFTNLLAHSDREGYVDKHFRAIADEVGLPMERVKAAIEVLESPDEESRSPELDGRRITKINDHRAWGWKIVNYAKYRAIKNDEDRREQNRASQERWRETHHPPKKSKAKIINSNQPVSDGEQSKPIGEGDAEGNGDADADGFSLGAIAPAKEETNPLILRVFSLYKRKPGTLLNTKSRKQAADITDEDLAAVELAWKKKWQFHRKDIATLLNNWPAEVERAKLYLTEIKSNGTAHQQSRSPANLAVFRDAPEREDTSAKTGRLF